MAKSLLDHAYDFLSHTNEQVNFKDMWNYVCKEAGLDEDLASKKVASFYTNLMLDGRFVTLGENIWDLRSRHTFDKVHIDMKDVYSDVETADDDTEELDSEEEAYNNAFEERNEEDSDFDEKEESEEEKEEEIL